jgi:Rad3-related DNA helicase
MENNQEGSSHSHSREEPREEGRRRESSLYDEELDEGKRVLDQLHQDYNERYESMHKELESQKERNRSSHERGESSQQEGFEKIDRRMEQPDNDPEKEESIDASRNLNKKPSKIFQGCNCLKSKCSKNYCECFTQGTLPLR